MMGRSHGLVGTTFGFGFAAVLSDAPLLVQLLVIPVTGGAALLPDIDHPSSRVARSLGVITKTIARGIDAVSLAVYHATRTDRDASSRHSGHRLLTHTIPGCVIAGVITAVTVLSHPIAGTAWLALLIGLLANGYRAVGTGFTVTGAGAAWLVLTHHFAWWWAFPVAVTVGALAHVIAGDYLTNSGVPLLWPLTVDGRRWSLLRAPATFKTGSAFETEFLTPVLLALMFLAAGVASGVVPAVIRAVVS